MEISRVTDAVSGGVTASTFACRMAVSQCRSRVARVAPSGPGRPATCVRPRIPSSRRCASSAFLSWPPRDR